MANPIEKEGSRAPDPAEAAALLRRLLAALERGELTAPATTIAALTGAAVALEGLAEMSESEPFDEK